MEAHGHCLPSPWTAARRAVLAAELPWPQPEAPQACFAPRLRGGDSDSRSESRRHGHWHVGTLSGATEWAAPRATECQCQGSPLSVGWGWPCIMSLAVLWRGSKAVFAGKFAAKRARGRLRYWPGRLGAQVASVSLSLPAGAGTKGPGHAACGRRHGAQGPANPAL